MNPPSLKLLTSCLLLLTIYGCAKPEPEIRYDPRADARGALVYAQQLATSNGRYLMVVFGAEWCPDCRNLHDNLHSSEVATYLEDHMDFVTIDVGRKDRNLVLAEELGVTVSNGIPVAVFFNPDGSQLGTTNDGQLEPSRHFTSRQILKFVRAVVEHRQISRPVVPARI
ncbi:MAG: thioredoxin fold domain-containing protein [Pseudomonadales bacterium]|nr:thioredoxin fold domain-containing protein [Pseudomonadales bacterium]